MSQREGTGLVKCRFENLSITQKKSLGIFRPLRRKALKIFRPQRRKAWAISSLDLPSLLRCSLASVWTKGKLAALTKKHTKTKTKTKTFTLLTFRILPICPNSATQQTQSMAPFYFFLIFPVADLLVGFIFGSPSSYQLSPIFLHLDKSACLPQSSWIIQHFQGGGKHFRWGEN